MTPQHSRGDSSPAGGGVSSGISGETLTGFEFSALTLFTLAVPACYIYGMKRGTLIFWLVVLALIVAGIGTSFVANRGPGKLDSFAQCLKDSGTVYYGAFWCPHCQATNKLFGKSKKLLPYIECSTPDGQDQTQICKDKNITGYPTWIFADGNILTGERTLAELAGASGCLLPST